MASFLFKNINTGETKVVNSKDSKQAHKYENGTWKYVKAVPKQQTTKSSKPSLKEVMSKLYEITGRAQRLRGAAQDYDCRFAYAGAKEIENACYELRQLLMKM